MNRHIVKILTILLLAALLRHGECEVSFCIKIFIITLFSLLSLVA